MNLRPKLTELSKNLSTQDQTLIRGNLSALGLAELLALPTSEPVATNALWWDAGVLRRAAGIPPTITSQPQSTEIAPDATATFTVTATNATSYQWQIDSGSGFADIAGATSSSYTTAAQALENDGDEYRVVVTGPGGSTTSSAAVLSVVSTRILSDSFDDGFSAEWTSTTHWTATNGIASLDMTATSGGSLTKTLSSSSLRFGATFDFTDCGTATLQFCSIEDGSGSIFLRFFYQGATESLICNFPVEYAGTPTTVNFLPGAGTPFVPSDKSDVRIEVCFDPVSSSVYVMANGVMWRCRYDGDDTASAIAAVKIGEQSTGSGTLRVKNVEVDTNVLKHIFAENNPNLDVVIAAGQSNMGGAAGNGTFSAGLDHPGPHVFSSIFSSPFESNQFVFDKSDYGTPLIPLTFLRQTSLQGRPVIVFAGAGGTSFTASNPQWADGGLRRQQLLDRIELIRVTNALPRGQRKFAVMLWHQGESDIATTEANYRTLFLDLIADLRAAAGSDFPVVMGGLSPANYATAPTPELAQMQLATDFSDEFAFASSRLPTPASAIVGEEIHFDAAGVRTMGERYADAFESLT